MVTGLAHVSLLISDLPQALRFYCQTLGLRAIERPDLGYPGAWLELPLGQQIHLLGLPPVPPPEHDRRPGHDRHLALQVSDIEALAARLAAAGVTSVRSRSGRAALFCRDPDGNALEFIEAR